LPPFIPTCFATGRHRDMPEDAREQPKHLISEDTSGIQIQSSARERPQHAFAKQEHAFAGAFSGMFVSFCLHPIDTVKTVIQSALQSRSLSPTLEDQLFLKEVNSSVKS